MTNWITDRPPTEADADWDGDVRIRYSPGSWISKHVHWSYVGAGVPWLPPSKPAPEPLATAPEPQPAPEPAPASPAPEPPATVATASEFLEAIRSGAAPFYVVVTPDDSGGVGGGHLMAWEAQIPEGSTLQSALRRQAHIGHHYGTAYIAECRIMPSLTSGSPAQQLRSEPEPVVTPPAAATEPRRVGQLFRTRNPDGSHTLDAIDDEGVAWVLYPGTGRWEELIHLPARRVPAQQPQS